MVTQQTATCRIPERRPGELVHFTGGERFACDRAGNWRTGNFRKVTCEGCKQTGTYRRAAIQDRDPVEICEDKADAYGSRLDFWIRHLKTGAVGKTGLHRRYGVQPRQIRTATGPAWGLFICPFDGGGIEYVPDTGEA
jgi:hypothetical protein